MGSVNIDSAQNLYGGNNINEIAEAIAKAEGYHIIIWLKKGNDWKSEQFGCCYQQQEVRQYLNSSDSINPQVVYDDGMAMSDEEVIQRAMENAEKANRWEQYESSNNTHTQNSSKSAWWKFW